MEARFTGDPRNGGEGKSPITVWGFTFVKDGDFVDVGAEERFARHDHFETRVGGKAKATPPPVAAAAPADPGPPAASDAKSALAANAEKVAAIRAELDALKVPYDKRVKKADVLAKILADAKATPPVAVDGEVAAYRAELIAQLEGLEVQFDPEASNEVLEAALDAATAPESDA